MAQSNFQKALSTTKEANAILSKAGGIVLKSSFNTAKKIAGLYKDAGLKAFSIGKEVVSTSLQLTIDNQKAVLKTSGQAIKDAAKSIREGVDPELKTMTSKQVKKSSRKGKRAK